MPENLTLLVYKDPDSLQGEWVWQVRKPPMQMLGIGHVSSVESAKASAEDFAERAVSYLRNPKESVAQAPLYDGSPPRPWAVPTRSYAPTNVTLSNDDLIAAYIAARDEAIANLRDHDDVTSEGPRMYALEGEIRARGLPVPPWPHKAAQGDPGPLYGDNLGHCTACVIAEAHKVALDNPGGPPGENMAALWLKFKEWLREHAIGTPSGGYADPYVFGSHHTGPY